MYGHLLEDCALCPRNCHVNRLKGEIGRCRVSGELKVARAALHMWEEPCISGEAGSGTVFFSGCSLGCVYCQNNNIAAGLAGKKITIERLAEIFLELQKKKANNINLVTPGHYIPQIMKAIELSRARGLELPIVYNTSSYEKAETLKLLEGYIDIYLPDIKYYDRAIAKKYSKAEGYFKYASEALQEMVHQVGKPEFREDGNYDKRCNCKTFDHSRIS